MIVATEGDRLLLTADEAARSLAISKRTLWRLVSAGQLPAPLHIGRAARWRRDEIVAAVDQWDGRVGLGG